MPFWIFPCKYCTFIKRLWNSKFNSVFRCSMVCTEYTFRSIFVDLTFDLHLWRARFEIQIDKFFTLILKLPFIHHLVLFINNGALPTLNQFGLFLLEYIGTHAGSTWDLWMWWFIHFFNSWFGVATFLHGSTFGWDQLISILAWSLQLLSLFNWRVSLFNN